MRRVIIPDLAEKVQLRSRQHQRSGNAMDRRVAPTFVIEVARGVEVVEERVIRV